MEKFIETKSGMLLNSYEYSGGLGSDDKTQKSRRKALKNETAIQIYDEADFYSDLTVEKVRRKDSWA